MGGAASAWVERFLGGVAAGGAVLDVACGGGRHVALCAERGFSVTGIDRDASAARVIAERFGEDRVALLEVDLETGAPFPVAGRLFDGVVVTNYLWRPILADIVAAVGPSGILIYETFAAGHERFGRPTNPDFLLRPGELCEAVHGRLVPVAYEHVMLATRGSPDRIVQRIAAVGPRHEWLREPPLANSI
ncbi:MAG: class I SAM-dependent methyltransferase [Hyphomicrobiaceae bacterium]|nr:class I SAM-dependent methyltransferase [Hyphomicrobiaceae bacterium]